MSTNEFLNLKEGTKVKLPFSISTEQYVFKVNIMEDTIETKPYDDDLTTYVNNYKSIELI